MDSYEQEPPTHGEEYIQIDESGNETPPPSSANPSFPEEVLPPAASPPHPRLKKKKNRCGRPVSNLQTALTGVTAGAGAAAIVSSALAERPPSFGKSFLYTCTVVGVGALYIGVLYFLYQKITALENTIARTLGDIRDLMAREEDDVMDEMLPVEELRMDTASASEEVLDTMEMDRQRAFTVPEAHAAAHASTHASTPVSPSHSVGDRQDSPQVSRPPTPVKKKRSPRKPVEKTPVLNLDEV